MCLSSCVLYIFVYVWPQYAAVYICCNTVGVQNSTGPLGGPVIIGRWICPKFVRKGRGSRAAYGGRTDVGVAYSERTDGQATIALRAIVACCFLYKGPFLVFLYVL